MRRGTRFLTVFLLVGLGVGCQPGHRYEGRTPGDSLPGLAGAPTAPKEEPKDIKPPPSLPPIAPEVGWIVPANPPSDIDIVFIGSDREEWSKLKDFWNYNESAKRVEIKVPLGLDDPKDRIPSANQPTVKKWALGKKLFFDNKYLSATRTISCAACHLPARYYSRNPDFSDGSIAGFDTPVLINAVYNPYQFWDGRAVLEEVVQRSLEDEREPPAGVARPHVWSGVIERLGSDAKWVELFKDTFGVPKPTQDMVGKAIATYLRTVLAGNALHDRAVRQAKLTRNASEPEPKDYTGILDEAVLAILDRKGANKEEVAASLHRGYQLFHDRVTPGAGCVRCHGGKTFSDGEFHNIGIGAPEQRPASGNETGRFRALPIGLKDGRTIAAFKTPTLRGLPDSKPYLHDSSAQEIEHAIELHFEGPMNPFLDTLLRDPTDTNQRRKMALSAEDLNALVGFLKALAGEPLPDVLADQQKYPPPSRGGL